MISYSNKNIFRDNNDNLNIISVKLSSLLNASSNNTIPESTISKCDNCSRYKTLNKNDCIFCNASLANGKIFSDIEFITYNERVLIICIDESSSMLGPRIDAVKKACLAAIDSIIGKNLQNKYKIGLITFSDRAFMLSCDGTKIQLPFIDLNKIQSVDDIKWSTEFDETKLKLDLLSNCEQKLRKHIDNLKAYSATMINSALFYSVLLASTALNTEIIICTDGEAQDCNSKFLDVIIDFANQKSTRINIITFPDCNFDLYSIEKLAKRTNGIISKSENEIEKQFFQIIEKTIQDQNDIQTGKVNVSLQTNQVDWVSFMDETQTNNCVRLQDVSSKEEELLFNRKNETHAMEYTKSEWDLINKFKNISSEEFKNLQQQQQQLPEILDKRIENETDNLNQIVNFESCKSNYEEVKLKLKNKLLNIEEFISNVTNGNQEHEKIRNQAKEMIKSTKLHQETTKIRLLLLSVVGEMLKELIAIFSFFDRIQQPQSGRESKQSSQQSTPQVINNQTNSQQSSSTSDSEDELSKYIDVLLESLKNLHTSQINTNPLAKQILDDFNEKMSQIIKSAIKDRLTSSINATIDIFGYMKTLSSANNQ